IHDDDGFHLDRFNVSLFKAEKEIAVQSNAMGVATGDFNDDGRDDVVVTNFDSDTVTVLLQDDQGSLSTKNHYGTSNWPSCVDTGDFNNDGLEDFAVGCLVGSSVDFFIQQSTGGFTRSVTSVVDGVQGIATGDLNNDDLDDVALATASQRGITLLQTSTGTFSVGQSITVGYTGGSSYYYTYVRDVAVADFNGDGRDDVVWATCNSYTYSYDYNQYGRVMLYYQTTSGLLTYYRYLWGYTGCWNIAAGDISGDGRPDIVFSQRYVNKVKFYLQTSSGSWSGPTTVNPDVGQPSKLALADLDKNGIDESIVGGTNDIITVMFHNYGSQGTLIKKLDTDHDVEQVTVGDLNNDGRVDLVTSNGNANSVSVWLQKDNFSATWRSDRIDLAAPLHSINFTTSINQRGGNTTLWYSFDEDNWTKMESGIFVDTPWRPDKLWIKLNTSTTRFDRYDKVKSVQIDMTFSAFPSDVTFDVGADGTVEWETTGEVINTVTADGFEDAITDFVLDPENPPDAGGWVTVPIMVHSATPGYLHMSNLRLLYNNASSAPDVLGPTNDTYVNGTPTFRFSALDDNDDVLKYVVQISTTEFNDTFDTFIFDMRDSLYDDTTGEGFPRSTFPEGSNAQFTLPEVYGLEMYTTYRWRVLAFDGHLVSDPSQPQTITVDTTPPVG
ncbi:MAG: VCBS repeat-containing protein, partial [Thermoplasmata archaeon]|nr:VCBS repeat-containing protein [Thermoplasmata archaeon]